MNLQFGWNKTIFWSLAAALFLVLQILAYNTGVNADDSFQTDYAEKLVDYYLSFGENKEALYVEKAQMHYYGGFFEVVSGMTNRLVGNEVNTIPYHHVRHLWIALFGWLAMVVTGLIAARMGGWRPAILALLFGFASPSFMGHALMNPKDIPFAAGYILTIYGMLRWADELPSKPSWKTLLVIIVGIGISIGTRIGGLLVIAYFGLFMLLWALFGNSLTKDSTFIDRMKTITIWGLISSFAGVVLGYLFWPFGMQAPIANAADALGKFSDFFVAIRILYLGENVMSDTTGWAYGVTWIGHTMPIFGFIGLIASLFLWKRLAARSHWTKVFILLFTAIFPILYIIYKESALYTGWRHLLFVYPSCVALMALAWSALLDLAKAQKAAWVSKVAMVILAVLVLEPLSFVARNPTISYLYFNPLVGGLSGNFGHMDTDYWGISVRDGIKWMEKEGILHANMKDTVRIASSYSYNMAQHLDPSYRGYVFPMYVTYNDRFSKEWDYGLFPSQYINGKQLRANGWPTKKAAHIVTANGVPILEIQVDKKHLTYRAKKAMEAGRNDEALALLQEELKVVPDNEVALGELCRLYLSGNKFAEAMILADQLVNIAPGSVQGYLYKGLIELNTKKVDQARNTFTVGIQNAPPTPTLFYYLAVAEKAKGNLVYAKDNAEKAIQMDPQFRDAYVLLAEIFDALGDAGMAQRVRAAIR